MKLPAVLALLAAAAPASEAADLARLRRPLAKGGESPAARRRSLRRRSRRGNRPTHRSLSNDELVGSVAAVEFLEAPTTKPPPAEKAHHLFHNNKKHGIKQTEFDIDEIGSVPSVESFLDVETTAPPPPPVKESSPPGHKAKSKIKQATFDIDEIGSVPSVESFLDVETTTTLPTKASSNPGPKEKSPGLKQSEFFGLSNDLELIDFGLEPAPVEEESCLSMDAAEFAEPVRRLVREDRKKRRRRKRRVA
ncbi:hypothetical protein ACHAXT_001580 [Thalassiosira profunda]